MKKIILAIFMVLLTACTDAEIASSNLRTDADNFKIYRRIVAFNGITDTYLLVVEGFCSIRKDNTDDQLEITCKTDDGYKKNFVGISDNVSYFVEQLQDSEVSTSNYKVIFKPSAIIPTIEKR